MILGFCVAICLILPVLILTKTPQVPDLLLLFIAWNIYRKKNRRRWKQWTTQGMQYSWFCDVLLALLFENKILLEVCNICNFVTCFISSFIWKQDTKRTRSEKVKVYILTYIKFVYVCIVGVLLLFNCKEWTLFMQDTQTKWFFRLALLPAIV